MNWRTACVAVDVSRRVAEVVAGSAEAADGKDAAVAAAVAQSAERRPDEDEEGNHELARGGGGVEALPVPSFFRRVRPSGPVTSSSVSSSVGYVVAALLKRLAEQHER